MKNMKMFLNTVTGITHKERLIIAACTTTLTGIGMYLNSKLFDKSIECMQLKKENEYLKVENKVLSMRNDSLYRVIYKK